MVGVFYTQRSLTNRKHQYINFHALFKSNLFFKDYLNGVLIGLFIFIPNIIINDFLCCSSIHACVLVKVLLRNFCNQEKCPPELYRQSSDMNSMVASVAGEIQIYSVFVIN